MTATGEPPAKQRRMYTGDEPEISDEVYDEAVQELIDEYTLR